MENVYNHLSSKDLDPQFLRCAVLAILVAKQGQVANRDIAEMTGLHVRNVQRIRKRLEVDRELPSMIAKHKSRPAASAKTVRNAALVRKIDRIVTRKPTKPIAAIAREVDQPRTTVSRIIHEDLRYVSYRRRTGQLLTQEKKDKRLAVAKKLLTKIKHPKTQNPLIFFSDEKNFCQEQKLNKQNDRWLARSPFLVPKIMRAKYPSHVMVFGVVSNEGDVMPPHFYEIGLRLNADRYIDMLRTVAIPWMKRVARGRPFLFQQDGAPCHTAAKTVRFFQESGINLLKPQFWPPNSPDLNPLDYFVWGVVERRSNAAPHNTKEQLRDGIRSAFRGLERAVVAKSCRRFRARVEAVIAANGDYFE